MALTPVTVSLSCATCRGNNVLIVSVPSRTTQPGDMVPDTNEVLAAVKRHGWIFDVKGSPQCPTCHTGRR
jgi:hypothetical protein